jgi:hypothetical protein
MIQLSAEYLAAGANRHPSVADWDAAGLLAYGADRNVALWRPQVIYSICLCEAYSLPLISVGDMLGILITPSIRVSMLKYL